MHAILDGGIAKQKKNNFKNKCITDRVHWIFAIIFYNVRQEDIIYVSVKIVLFLLAKKNGMKKKNKHLIVK